MKKLNYDKFNYKISIFEEAYTKIEKLMKIDFNELRDNLQWDAILWNLYVSIQSLLDASIQLVVPLDVKPESYKQIVKAIVENQIIDDQLGAVFESFAGFRNIIAHSYNNLDVDLIYQNLNSDRKSLILIAKALKQYAEKMFDSK
jgi:uncharacterized protein YutE (UPF0331/DUF86 family)